MLIKSSETPLVLFHTFFVNYTVRPHAFLKGICALRILKTRLFRLKVFKLILRILKTLPTRLFKLKVVKVINAAEFTTCEIEAAPPSLSVALRPAQIWQIMLTHFDVKPHAIVIVN
jgi:hypothetical protein